MVFIFVSFVFDACPTDMHHTMQDVPTASRNSSYDRRSDRRHTHHPLGQALAIIVCDNVFVYHRRVYVLTPEVVFPVSLTDSLFLCPLDLPRYVMGSFIVCRVSRPVAWKFWKVERTLSLHSSTLHASLFLPVFELCLILRSG